MIGTRGHFILLLLAFAAAIRLSSLDWSSFLQLDVSEHFISNRAASPTQLAISHLRDEQARYIFFRSPNNASVAEQLTRSPRITQASASVFDRERVSKTLYEHRFELFFPHWLEEHSEGSPSAEGLARSAVSELEAFLDSPQSLGFEDLLFADPLLLLPRFMDSLQSLPTMGLDVGWARIEDSPFHSSLAQQVVRDIESLLAHETSGTQWTGVVKFAEESSRVIRNEVGLLNTVSLLLLSLLAVLLLRSPLRVLHLLVPVVFSITLALASCSLIFDSVHILALILGSILAGVTIDFGIHLMLHCSGERKRVVMGALVLACVTSATGFAVLIFSSNPVIRQVGVLVSTGLVVALACALLYRPLVEHQGNLRFADKWDRSLFRIAPSRAWAVALVLISAATALVGVSWSDDVRILDIKHSQLKQESAQFTSGDSSPNVFILGGKELLALLAQLEASDKSSWTKQFTNERNANLTKEQQSVLDEFPKALRRELNNRGYKEALFSPFFADFEGYSKAIAEQGGMVLARAKLAELAKALDGPAGFLLGERGGIAWVGFFDSVAAEETGALALSVEPELRNGLEPVRRQLLEIGAILVTVMLSVVCILFRRRSWTSIAFSSMLGLLMAFSLVAWFGEVNVFHLTGLLLGLCLSLDYSIFYVICRDRGLPYPYSIRFSALTTLVAFSVLLFSSIEAVRSLGITVILSIVLTHLFLEWERNRHERGLA